LVVLMELFGFQIPLSVLFIIGIIAVIILWKVIKFAIKILLLVVVFFLVLFGLDMIGVFEHIQNLFSSLI
jgi:hypothetical protein